jgi:hypothetical protein
MRRATKAARRRCSSSMPDSSADHRGAAHPGRAAAPRRGRRRPLQRRLGCFPRGARRRSAGLRRRSCSTGRRRRRAWTGARRRCRHAAGGLVAAADLLALTLLTLARGVGRRRGRRHGAALRRADGFGGPHAAFIAVREGLAALDAGPPRRRQRGRRRAPGATASRCRPASSTSVARRPPATSAPRRCCSPSWPGMYAVYHGPDGLRRIAERVHASPAAAAAACGRRRRARARHLLRHDSPCGCPRRPDEVIAAALDGRAQPAAGRRDHGGVQLRRDHRRRRRASVLAPSGPGGAWPTTPGKTYPRGPTRSAHRRVPDPPVFHVPLRDRDDALPAALADRTCARPHHDPAGLVHDEAQRHHRDGADHLARVRRCTRSRRATRRGATGADRRARADGWSRSPATTP